MSHPGCTVFLVTRADPAARLRLGLWALTAASVGERVEVLFAGEALQAWAAGRWDEALEGEGQGAGLLPPTQLLAEARLLAPVRLVSCDTELRLAGVEDAAARARLDEVVSLPSFWRETQGARMVSL